MIMRLHQITLNIVHAFVSFASVRRGLVNVRESAHHTQIEPQTMWKIIPFPFHAGFLKTVQRCVVCLVMLAAPAISMFCSGLARAEPDGLIEVELNRIRTLGGACRLSFVFVNKLAEPVETLSLETVLFDKAGQVERFVVLKLRPLPPKKMRVQEFDITGARCDTFGRLLLNDVRECGVGGGEPASCLEKLVPSSRTDLPFVTSIQ